MAQKAEDLLIRVDHREVGSGVPEALAELAQVDVCIESLDVADYLLSARVAVERKAATDFVASIPDRRLFSQAERLSQTYELAICLVEGPSLYEESRVHPNAIRGALSYLMLLGGVSVIRSESPQDSALLLATMARHEQQGLGYEISYHAPRRSLSPELQMRYLVEDLPGIGPAMADSLLRRFGNLRRLFSASDEELRQVRGIGQKRARLIHDLLTRTYGGRNDVAEVAT